VRAQLAGPVEGERRLVGLAGILEGRRGRRRVGPGGRDRRLGRLVLGACRRELLGSADAWRTTVARSACRSSQRRSDVGSPAVASSARSFSSRSSAVVTAAAASVRPPGRRPPPWPGVDRPRTTHCREPRDLVVELVQCGLGLLGGVLRLREPGQGGVDVGDQPVGRLDPRGGFGQGRLVGVGVPGEQAVDGLELDVGLIGDHAGALPHPAVDLEAQQVDQDLLPVGRLGVQERGELALWQHHALGELLVRQADHLGDGLVDLAGRAGQHLAELAVDLPVVVEPAQVEAAGQRLQAGLPGGHRALAVAAHHAG
jgi:hypothetical protein